MRMALIQFFVQMFIGLSVENYRNAKFQHEGELSFVLGLTRPSLVLKTWHSFHRFDVERYGLMLFRARESRNPLHFRQFLVKLEARMRGNVCRVDTSPRRQSIR